MTSQTMVQTFCVTSGIMIQQLNLIEAMPTSGTNGTLKYRQSMRKAPIQGNIIAKSGSLYGSYNMAGFGLDKKGKTKLSICAVCT